MNRAQAPALALLLAACAWLPACGLNQAGVTPPDNTIAFPASAVMDQGGNWLFVTNSNADLRYNDGTLLAFNLNRVEADRETTVDPPFGKCSQISEPNPLSDDKDRCCRDLLDLNVLNCDERQYIGPTGDTGNGDANVRIGSFAAGMVLQHRACPMTPGGVAICPQACMDAPGNDRLLIGVRGDTSLTFVDLGPSEAETPPLMTCSTAGGAFATCDDGYRVNETGSAIAGPTEEEHPPEVTLPDEPYALAIDDTQGLLFVGHLSGSTARPLTGGFSLFDVMTIGVAPLDPPRLIGPFPSPFAPNSVGSVGVTAMKFTNGGIYASSRYVPQVAQLGVTGVCPQDGSPIREIAAFPVGNTYTSPLAGAETRGIQFVGEGADQRAFILQRNPPALIAFEDHTTVDRTATDILETCGSPTFLDQHNNGAGARLFVTCTGDGEIYVFDPSIPVLVKTFTVGRGPAGLVFDDTIVNDHPRNVAYSVNFGDNDIAVIDLEPGSLTEYHVIQRIGFPRTSPR